MDIRYHVDPDTQLPHIYGHGVKESEIEEIFRNSFEEIAGDRDSRIRLGQTDAGRYLKVIYSPDDGFDSVFVITAYELRGKEKQAYRRRKRRKS